MNQSQLNTRNRDLQLSFSWRKNCQEGPKIPIPIPVCLNQGKAPLLLHLLPPPWAFCSSSLENWTVFLWFSGFPEATHLLFDYYWGAILFLLPHLPCGPEATWHHMKEKLLSWFFLGFLYPRIFLCSWSETGHYFRCQQGCVCVLGCVFTALGQMKWWLPLCLLNQCSTFNTVLSQAWPQKCSFFTLSHSNTNPARKQSRDCQFQSCQQNLEMRLWNPWALSFPTLEMRKRSQHEGGSAFPFPPSSGHEQTQGARWVTNLLQAALLSPARPGQPTAAAHTLIMCSYHSRWSERPGLQRMTRFGRWSFLGRDSHEPRVGSKHSRSGSDIPSVGTQQCWVWPEIITIQNSQRCPNNPENTSILQNTQEKQGSSSHCTWKR